MKIDWTKLVGFTVEKVQETKVETKMTCVDCDCEENQTLMVVSFVNDSEVQQDVFFEDGCPARMSEPFSIVEDDE